MDQEMNTIVANIESLLEQLKQMAGGGAAPAAKAEDGTKPEINPEMMDKVLKYLKELDDSGKPKDDEKELEDKKVDKAITPGKDEGTDGGTNADDKAETQIEELPEETKAGISEIQKALEKILKAKEVKKSVDPVQKMYEVVKTLVDEMTEVKKAQVNMLRGFGIADEIIKMSEVKKTEDRPVPVVNDPQEIKKSIEEMKNMLGNRTGSIPYVNEDSHGLAKSLASDGGEMLKGLFSKWK